MSMLFPYSKTYAVSASVETSEGQRDTVTIVFYRYDRFALFLFDCIDSFVLILEMN